MSVKPPILVPRPETEELVDKILEWWGDRRAPRFLDVGCGTGCIGLALLQALGPDSSCVAIDNDHQAVALARENGRDRPGYSVIHRSADTRKPPSEVPFDFIVSNPPYIPTANLDTLEPEVAHYEARGALDGGPDGLDVVRSILARAPTYLHSDSTRTVWLELDDSHPSLFASDSFRATFTCKREHTLLDNTEVEAFDDTFGNPRFVRLSFQPTRRKSL